MRCPDCGTRVEPPIEAHARKACTDCDAPLLQPTAI